MPLRPPFAGIFSAAAAKSFKAVATLLTAFNWSSLSAPAFSAMLTYTSINVPRPFAKLLTMPAKESPSPELNRLLMLFRRLAAVKYATAAARFLIPVATVGFTSDAIFKNGCNSVMKAVRFLAIDTSPADTKPPTRPPKNPPIASPMSGPILVAFLRTFITLSSPI